MRLPFCWSGLAALRSPALDIFALVFLGVLALAALRKIRESPTSEPFDNPAVWRYRKVLTFENPRLIPPPVVGMTIVSGRLAAAVALPPQSNSQAVGRLTLVSEMTTTKASLTIAIPKDGVSAGEFSCSGWARGCGFKSAREGFVVSGMPEYTYLNARGDYWQCERVCAAVQKDRVAVTLPLPLIDHSNDSCERWKCRNALRKQQDSCLAP